MHFSNHFNISTTGSETWFDPILDDDTLLFVDPFLIYLDNSGHFTGGYQKMMTYFENIFLEAAKVPYSYNSPRSKVLTSKVVFKEPKEACLGYSVGSVDGAGSGSGFAKNIIQAVYNSINAGITNLDHFEELGIFNSNIKEDRISDITLNILKEEFISYTQSICQNLNIRLDNLQCRVFDPQSSRWVFKPYLLPKNPFNNGPIILIPKKFLATINALNSQDFFDFCWQQYDDNVKDILNVTIKSHVDKAKIVSLAKQNPEWVESYLRYKEAERDNEAYDLDLDPAGVYKWQYATENYTAANPLSLNITDFNSFQQFIDAISNSFQSFIEDHEGFQLLVNEGNKPKSEKACQLLLYGLIKHYCKAINCRIEVKNAGRGIITFRFSQRIEFSAFMEIKYARNSEIQKTFDTFLKSQKNGDQTVIGYYFVVGFKLAEMEKANDLEEPLLELGEEYNFRLKFKTINALIDK
ncbi:hypothetical protein [Pedobacter heparinus]|uniref:hypothetical protein n=1 Tax=Pedobacter heparinus TaxID=984 RepID=UPI00292FD3F1|nr:hypothetical protein [Pedobacter heparinus]